MTQNIHIDIPDDPYVLFERWFQDAQKHEPDYPNAMTIATVDNNGAPSARVVLLRGFDEHGFQFFTNYQSNKGKALNATQKIEANFYWKSTQKQIRIHGNVSQLSAEKSDLYFQSRPRASQIGAWASQQSRPMSTYADLESRQKDYEEKFKTEEKIPRPPHWGGYHITPETIEFWEEQPYRLHKRFIYQKSKNAKNWSMQWLYP